MALTLTNEDLQAIKSMLDPRFDRIDERFDGLEEDMSRLEGHVDSLEEHVNSLEEHVNSIEEHVNSIEEHVGSLEERVGSLEEHVDSLDSKVSSLSVDMEDVKGRLTRIEVVQLENYLIPKVEEIAAYQKSVYERYTKDADRFEEKISLVDSIDATVKKHSEQIQELQLKQA
jgi:chromosome segregation ATPase